LTGTATEGFEILESDWKINQPAYSSHPWLKFQTEQGYMIIHPSEMEDIGPDKLGESIDITAVRFDLIGINQKIL